MRHIPVLLNEVIDALELKAGDNVVDCTLGDAGHSEVILEKTSPDGKLIGIDADPESLLRAKKFLDKFGDRVVYVRDNFKNLKKIIQEKNLSSVDAILIDLGWSSPQFEERNRGFSFMNDEPLDMRYSSGGIIDKDELTAADIVNNRDKIELSSIFKKYGEEKLSIEIADMIVEFRKEKKISTSKELSEIILSVYRKKLNTTKEIPWIGGLHPSTKVFQALRIEVNNELDILKEVLPQALDILSVGGRLAVISFHSLEDRIVKHYFRSIVPRYASFIHKKPVIASEDELKINNRARSAKLRVIKKNY